MNLFVAKAKIKLISIHFFRGVARYPVTRVPT